MAGHPPRANPGLFRDVLQILLASPDGSCRLPIIDIFLQLDKRRRASYDIDAADDLESCLRQHPEVFLVSGFGRHLSGSPAIQLSICSKHSYVVGSCPEQTCADLHFCMFYLLSGRCAYGKDHCLFGHDLSTDHNRRLLDRHLLGGLTLTELRSLFCLPWVRRGVTVPKVCRYDNVHSGCSKGQHCRSLHICLPYVLQRCKFGKKCKRTHDINHPQVTQVLTLYGVKVTGRPLKAILDEVRTYQRDHNSNGDDSGDDDDAHKRMSSMTTGRARIKSFGSVPNLFQGSELSLAPRVNGRRERGPSATRRPRQQSESSYGALARPGRAATERVEEICIYHLMKTCRFGSTCNRLHSDVPFLWRVTAWEDGGQDVVWRSLGEESNILLERYYCQPHVTECTVNDVDGSQMKVNLRRFTATNPTDKLEYRLRRLSTPSSVDPGSLRAGFARQLPTVWLWYWRDAEGAWKEFGFEDDEDTRLSLGSDAVEQNYLTSANTPLKVDHLVLDFGKMRLKDRATGLKIKVRRRPQLQLRNHDAESEDGSVDPSSDGEADADVSDNISDDDDEAQATEVQTADDFLILLKASGKEHNKIRGHFCGTVGKGVRIISIHRVKNQLLADAFHRKKKAMSRGSPRQAAAERTLYYGPEPGEDVVSICHHGVQCNHHGATANDKPLGKGGYFHVNAARACKSGHERGVVERRAFLVKCLVGASGKGSPTLVLPPAVDSRQASGKRFDSCADDLRNPKTFVVFDKSQVRPAYLITYTLSVS